MRRPILITNVAFGPLYTDLFLTQCLKSLLDETNIPSCAEQIHFTIFSDNYSAKVIQHHPNFVRLRALLGERLESRKESPRS